MASRWLEELPASPLRYLLFPANLVLRGAVVLRNVAFNRGWATVRRLPVPVISVGNLAVGGTGKTPAVRLVCALLTSLGQRPVVLSRGYRAQDGANEEAQLVGDVPVVADLDRHRGGLAAISRHHATCLVLDDGFQHRRLHRDLDLVLIDATDPWGGGALLPLGRLREPVHALSRAQGLWLTRADLVPTPALIAITALLASVQRELLVSSQGPVTVASLDGLQVLPPAACTGPVVLCCGLGNPQAFEATALRAGLAVVESLRYPDHFHYRLADVSALVLRARACAGRLLISAKDAVKVRALAAQLPAADAALIWEMRAEPELLADGQERLTLLLKQALRARPA